MLAVSALGATATDQDKLSAANSGFAFALVKQLAREKPDANVFVSPYSISVALQMACNGAGGDTRKEMEQVLGTAGLSAAAMGQAQKQLGQSLENCSSNAVLSIANSIWFAPNIQLKSDFESFNREYYGAKLSALDFTDPRASGVVNRWVDENTHGKIKKLVEGPLSGMTGAFIANAVYFKGTWETPFDNKKTDSHPFHSTRGGSVDLPMMHREGEFEYQQAGDFQAVRLPYTGARLGMFVLLPATNSSVEKVLGALDGESWQSVVRPKFAKAKGSIGLPRFKVEYQADLNNPLKALGMRKAFQARAADFSGMSDTSLYVDAVKHKSFVEVNEEGTVAAAVTGLTMRMTSVRIEPPPFRMIVDRPFLFLIEDRETKSLLFIGIINELSE